MVSAFSLVHFKNYEQGEFQFSSDLNFVVGRNGIGKTNLLDAIYYLCMTRSHSTPLDRDTVEFGKPFFRLEADVITLGSPEHVIIKVQPGRTKDQGRNSAGDQPYCSVFDARRAPASAI